MELAVGSIVEGKVTGITKFGAFVSLPGAKSGLVHISEIANTYVNDVHDHLTEGQTVNVKVISIDPAGKISLSIKKALEPAPRPAAARPQAAAARPQTGARRTGGANAPREPQTFEDKLKAFMSESDNKISGIKQYSDHRTKTRKK